MDRPDDRAYDPEKDAKSGDCGGMLAGPGLPDHECDVETAGGPCAALSLFGCDHSHGKDPVGGIVSLRAHKRIFFLCAHLCADASKEIRYSACGAGNVDRLVQTLPVRTFSHRCSGRIPCGNVFQRGGLCLLSASGAEKTALDNQFFTKLYLFS